MQEKWWYKLFTLEVTRFLCLQLLLGEYSLLEIRLSSFYFFDALKKKLIIGSKATMCRSQPLIPEHTPLYICFYLLEDHNKDK